MCWVCFGGMVDNGSEDNVDTVDADEGFELTD